MLRTRRRLLEFPADTSWSAVAPLCGVNLDGDSYRLRDHQHESESGGLAYAAHGVAASPTPMPRATA